MQVMKEEPFIKLSWMVYKKDMKMIDFTNSMGCSHRRHRHQ